MVRMDHKFTPKTPGKGMEMSSTKQFIDSYKAQREMQSQILEQRTTAIAAEDPAQAQLGSLIGKQSGKTKIDRTQLFNKHNIGEQISKDQPAKKEEVKVAIGGAMRDNKLDQSTVAVKKEKKGDTDRAKELGSIDSMAN